MRTESLFDWIVAQMRRPLVLWRNTTALVTFLEEAMVIKVGTIVEVVVEDIEVDAETRTNSGETVITTMATIVNIMVTVVDIGVGVEGDITLRIALITKASSIHSISHIANKAEEDVDVVV